MLDLAKEIMGIQQLPVFLDNIILDHEISCYLHKLHEMMRHKISNFEKKEKLLLLISALIQNYGHSFENFIQECNEAKLSLRKGVMPIETATLTGFSDQSHFTNTFRSFTGLTPGLYRNIFLKK